MEIGKTEDSTLWVQAGLRLSEPLHSKALEAAKALGWLEGEGQGLRHITQGISVDGAPPVIQFLYCNMPSIKAIFLSQDLLGQHVMSS